MGSSKSKPVAPPYAPTYCDFQQHRSSNIVPTLWEVPAAKAILLGTLDQNCMFSRVSARVTEQILKTILMDAYALCSDESSAGRYDWSKVYQSRGCAYNSGSGQGLIIAAGCGDVLGVSSVCLLAPHLLLHKRENEVTHVSPLVDSVPLPHCLIHTRDWRWPFLLIHCGYQCSLTDLRR